ncbi:unnamed protein product, partial [Prorocentrum cordatum]
AGEFQGHAAVAPPGQAQPGAGPEVEAAARSEHQVAEFQQWWDAGHGAGAAAEHAVLGLIDVCQLAQIVSAGAGYHTILTLDRLDALQRRIASDGRAELDPLRRALQARGGAKPQARAVGSLLFREALALFLGLRQGRPGAAPGAALASSPRGPPMGQAGAAVAAGTPPRRGGDGAAAAGATSDAAGAAALDEAWEPPRPFVVCSEDGSACAARPATRASCSPACPAAPSSWRRGATGSSSLCRPSVPGASLAPPLCPWPPAAFSCWSRRQPPRSGGAPAAGAGPAGPRRRGRRRLALRRCWLRTRRRASWRWRPRCSPTRTPSSAPCARSWRASARAWVLRRPCSRAWPSPATVVPQLLRRTRWRRRCCVRCPRSPDRTPRPAAGGRVDAERRRGSRGGPRRAEGTVPAYEKGRRAGGAVEFGAQIRRIRARAVAGGRRGCGTRGAQRPPAERGRRGGEPNLAWRCQNSAPCGPRAAWQPRRVP